MCVVKQQVKLGQLSWSSVLLSVSWATVYARKQSISVFYAKKTQKGQTKRIKPCIHPDRLDWKADV